MALLTEQQRDEVTAQFMQQALGPLSVLKNGYSCGSRWIRFLV